MSSVVTIPSDQMNHSAGHVRDHWHAFVPAHTRIADVLKSTFWAHHITKLRPFCLVDLMTRDGLLDITVRIVSITNGIVKVNVIRHYEDEEARAPIIQQWIDQQERGVDKLPGHVRANEVQGWVPEGYKVGWNPGSSTFYVQFKATGQQFVQNLTDERVAVRAARAHARAAGVDVPHDEAIDGEAPAAKTEGEGGRRPKRNAA